MGALTANTPKPMLPVAGRPFLDHMIQEVARFGFERITLLAGQFGMQIAETYAGRTMYGAQIEVMIEPAPIGTGGALRFAMDQLAHEFLLMNGDSWIEADLVAFTRQWRDLKESLAGLRAQLLLQQVPDAGRFGAVRLRNAKSRSGLIDAFQEKADAMSGLPGLISAGVYILDREVVDEIAADRPVSFERDVLPPLVAAGRVAGVKAAADAYFVDIGVPISYAAAQTGVIRHRTRPALFLDRDGTMNVDHGYTHQVDDLEWQPRAKEAVALANKLGYFVFVVTNQAGIAHGYYGEEAVRQFHTAMQKDLFQIGGHIDAFEWCPFHPEAAVDVWRQVSQRRKPGSGMIEDLIAAWPVDRQRSLMVGDKSSDILAAEAANIRGVLYSGGSLFDLIARELDEE